MPGKNAIFTEEEAKGRLCPKTIGAYPGECQGSRCMAWRWFATHVTVPGRAPITVSNIAGETNVVHDSDKMELVGDRYGFCGLAGEPDCRNFPDGRVAYRNA